MGQLTYIRKDLLGLTQAEMAALTGVSQATVCRWEKGEQEPNRSEMARIRDEALRRDLQWSDSLFFSGPAALSAEVAA